MRTDYLTTAATAVLVIFLGGACIHYVVNHISEPHKSSQQPVEELGASSFDDASAVIVPQ